VIGQDDRVNFIVPPIVRLPTSIALTDVAARTPAYNVVL